LLLSSAREIEAKWQHKWEGAKIFEADPNNKPKCFVNFPYPYMNGYLHLGHAFSLMRVEVYARYKRMLGFNVLFPFAFHCTGTPIVAAAQRIAENEEKQIEIMRGMGIPESEIPKFADPVYWCEFFPRETIRDLKAMGMSIDWRRSFITTSLNPFYDKFIKWQFNKLKAGGFISIGEHPVVWCPKCRNPVGDHARLEGEGVTPEEIYLIKFELEGKILPTATYRPETAYGVTNLWVLSDAEYFMAKVDEEIWIASREALEKLKEQKHRVEITGSLKGSELAGKRCLNRVTGVEVPILPARFIELKVGTGIVMSVPSHAPYDYAALKELKLNPHGFGVSQELVEKIKPISLISIEGFGEHPAVELVEAMGIESQSDDKLKEATRELYRREFHSGVLKANTGRYAGKKVFEAKAEIVNDFIAENKAAIFYELPERVVCRCLSECMVKIVSNQWFLNYEDKNWKAKAREVLDKMVFYPEKARMQFEYVIDWLKAWACTRELGLGTVLPWDDKWVIESLSDSTIYMAYYTIAKYLEDSKYGIKAENIDDAFFDYIFLGRGDRIEVAKRVDIDVKLLDAIKQEFEYWYPFDFRNSGKDLVQNHLAFCIFNHAAIFPEKYWPRAFGVNGWVQVDGEKMSKSKGNFFTLRQIYERFGADVTRFTLMYAGEGLDDPNWETEFAKAAGAKLEQWYNFAIENYGKGRGERKQIDDWFDSKVHRTLKEVREAMERTDFRTALQKGFFDMQNYLRWYARRTREFNARSISSFIEIQTLILAPFVPHICEEIWEKIGKREFISLAAYPEYDASKINERVEKAEEYLKDLIADIHEILKVAKIENPKVAYIYTAEEWKWKALKLASGKSFNEAMKEIMKREEMRKLGREVAKFIQKIASEKTAIEELPEEQILLEAKEFIERETQLEIEINPPIDPENKRRLALPLRPAIYIK
jgi:leucyl-tRNA synthetase